MSVLFGLSVVNVIDKKISNVQVNIPPIQVPKQNITIKVKCDENTNLSHNRITQIENTIIEEPMKNTKLEYTKNIIEGFEDSYSIDTIEDIQQKIDNPSKNLIVSHNKIEEEKSAPVITRTYYEPGPNDMQKLQPLKFQKCSNTHSNDKIYKNPLNKHTNNEKYKMHVSRMGPYKMFAANYSDYNDYVNPRDINRTIVARSSEKIKKDLIPKGSNFTFSDSPALKRDL